jgi:preprotein translocase SecE subunit
VLPDLGAVPVQGGEPGDGAPDPIEHAAPDAELAEAQLATASRLDTVAEPSAEEEVAEAEMEPTEPDSRASVRAPRTPVPAAQSAVVVRRPWIGARLVFFLEGSWRELQRVQWPDRRQVMQATGVVVGFVIVASVFLGVADLVASKVVHFILNGHF